jgi:phage N-6-adenine-methyltransferase
MQSSSSEQLSEKRNRKSMKVADREAVFSTGKDDWGTPHRLFRALHDEFNFCVDVCATAENALTYQWVGPGSMVEDALEGDWARVCNEAHSAKRYFTHTMFMNPPYSNVEDFMRVMSEEAQKNPTTRYVALVASRTDTKWFHNYVLNQASEIRFIKGRVTFAGAPSTAPFPSLVVVYNTLVSGEKYQETLSWSYR